MHELRKDLLLGGWIAVLSDSRAPSDYPGPYARAEETSCILCSGRENETPPEIASIRKPGSKKWWVRAIPSFNPVFRVEGDLGRRGMGIYDKMNSVGANEILVESPDHSERPEDMGLEQMVRIITLYRNRISDLEKDSRLRYILIYKNSGMEAGETFSHPHSLLMATPVIPKLVKDELDNAKQYFAYKERCVFCDIVSEELRLGERVIFESKHFAAFCPYAAQFPFECWIIPKRHSCAFQEILGEDNVFEYLANSDPAGERVLSNSRWNLDSSLLASSSNRTASDPTVESSLLFRGLRVASVPEPSSLLLSTLGILGLIGRRRRAG